MNGIVMRFSRWVLAVVIVLSLVACGGGGGGDSRLTVTATAGTGGSISPASLSVNRGETASFTVTPQSAYRIGSVTGCGGSLSGNTYTTGSITQACQVTASFELITINVNATAGPGGSITPTSQFVNPGTSANFTVTPNDGYAIANVEGCGGSLSGNTYTTGPITAACTVSATFNQLPPTGLNLTPQAIKTFGFTWNTVPWATEYRLLEGADRSSGFTEVAVIPAGAVSFDLEGVFLPERINSRYVLQACNGAGCTSSAEVSVATSLAEAVGYFKPSTPQVSGWFGNSVSLSTDGRTLAVGAPFENGSDGGVYVFERGNDGDWKETIRLSSPCVGCWFGYAVSLSDDGKQLAVGAPDALELPPNSQDLFSGFVYTFSRFSEEIWLSSGVLRSPYPTSGFAFFGLALALSGDGSTLVVGMPNQGLGQNDGAAFVFVRDIEWTFQKDLTEVDAPDGNGRYGAALAISYDGNRVAVGEPWTSFVNPVAGRVIVFERDRQLGWQFLTEIDGARPELELGTAVALSADGSLLAAGAPGDSSGATGINGNEADDSESRSGAVYVYRMPETFIVPLPPTFREAYIKPNNTRDFYEFGTSLAFDAAGRALVVGSAKERSNATGINGDDQNDRAQNAGAAYLFIREAGGVWDQQRAYIKASNTHADSIAANSVAISADGKTLAVGAPGERSSGAGIGGDQSDRSLEEAGAVYLY